MAFLGIQRKSTPESKVPSQLPDLAPEQMGLTEAAAKRINELLLEKGLAHGYMRVGVLGGGCSGFSYNFSVEPEKAANDAAFEGYGATMIVDPKSLKMLGGTWLDFENSFTKKGFKLRNPRQVKSCACGQSFSL